MGSRNGACVGSKEPLTAALNVEDDAKASSQL